MPSPLPVGKLPHELLATLLSRVASQRTLQVDPDAIPVPPLTGRVCAAFGIDPLCSIASGSLLITAPAADAPAIFQALQCPSIGCAEIGVVVDGPGLVQRSTPGGFVAWPRPAAWCWNGARSRGQESINH